MSEETIQSQETPEEFKKATWLGNQIVKYPLRTIFIMLLIVIGTMSGVTTYFYNKMEKDRNEYIAETKSKWIKLSEKQEKEIIEYKTMWINCMSMQVERINRMDSITSGKRKNKKIK